MAFSAATWAEFLAKGSIPVIVAAAFAMAWRYSPGDPSKYYDDSINDSGDDPNEDQSEDQSDDSGDDLIGQLSARFALTNKKVYAGVVVIGAIMAVGIHWAFTLMNQQVVSFEGPSDFVILPQTAIWWFLPGFSALTMAWEITLGLWGFIGDKDEMELFKFWTYAKTVSDPTKVLRRMAVAFWLPIAIFTALAVPEHTVLQNNGIRVRGYGLSPSQTFRYQDAQRLTVFDGIRDRDGKLERRPDIVLDFSHGRRWASTDMGDFKHNIDVALLQYLQIKTGLQPRHQEAEL